LSYIEKSLIEGETVLYRARLHWIVLLWPALAGGLAGILGIGFLVGGVYHSARASGFSGTMGIVGFLLFLGALVLIGGGIVKRNSTEIAVTSRRVLIKTGVANRKTLELLLSRIESIGVNETPLGRMLGYGTVVLRGTGGTPEQFDRIDKPLEFRRQVQSQVEGLSPAFTSKGAARAPSSGDTG
jgi:membrane protein YdbS with pleckstrin-like domain